MAIPLNNGQLNDSILEKKIQITLVTTIIIGKKDKLSVTKILVYSHRK